MIKWNKNTLRARREIQSTRLVFLSLKERLIFLRRRFIKLWQIMTSCAGSRQTRIRWYLQDMISNCRESGAFIFTGRERESFTPHIELGSGRDLAGSYLTAKLSGLDNTKLSMSDLAFFAMRFHTPQ